MPQRWGNDLAKSVPSGVRRSTFAHGSYPQIVAGRQTRQQFDCCIAAGFRRQFLNWVPCPQRRPQWLLIGSSGSRAELTPAIWSSIAGLPGRAQENLPIYAPKGARVLERPSPCLIKRNLKHLLAVEGVYHGDVAAETGITRSSRCGNCAIRNSASPVFARSVQVFWRNAG